VKVVLGRVVVVVVVVVVVLVGTVVVVDVEVLLVGTVVLVVVDVLEALLVEVEPVMIEDELTLVVAGWLVVVVTLVPAGTCRNLEGAVAVQLRTSGERSTCRCRKPDSPDTAAPG